MLTSLHVTVRKTYAQHDSTTTVFDCRDGINEVILSA